MLRKLSLIVALSAAALAAPSAVTASHGDGNRAIARAECREDRPDATRREIRRCARQAVRAARRGCRAERRDDRAAFRAKYGEHPRRACVRAALTA